MLTRTKIVTLNDVISAFQIFVGKYQKFYTKYFLNTETFLKYFINYINIVF